jgi:AcrR family transcriptional regulator
MEVVARRGFDATVEEIAQVSGVSPRTIFRHFETHDRLIAETVSDMFGACRLPRRSVDIDDWVEGLPRHIEDLGAWIEHIAVTFHTRSASIFGAAFWDIYGPPRHNASEVLAEISTIRRDYRLRGISHIVNLVWRTAGGTGEPPEDLVMAFALYLSVFTTQALMVDFDQTPAQIGTLAADICTMLLWRAEEAQRPAGADFPTDSEIAESHGMAEQD